MPKGSPDEPLSNAEKIARLKRGAAARRAPESLSAEERRARMVRGTVLGMLVVVAVVVLIVVLTLNASAPQL